MTQTAPSTTLISTECATDMRHYSCAPTGTAWDPVLDHAADCGCWCHQAAAHLSPACGSGGSHETCGRVDAGWDVLLDRATPCECGCHLLRS